MVLLVANFHPVYHYFVLAMGLFGSQDLVITFVLVFYRSIKLFFVPRFFRFGIHTDVAIVVFTVEFEIGLRQSGVLLTKSPNG